MIVQSIFAIFCFEMGNGNTFASVTFVPACEGGQAGTGGAVGVRGALGAVRRAPEVIGAAETDKSSRRFGTRTVLFLFCLLTAMPNYLCSKPFLFKTNMIII